MYTAKSLSRLFTNINSSTRILEALDWDEDELSLLMSKISKFIEKYKGKPEYFINDIRFLLKKDDRDKEIIDSILDIIMSEINFQYESERYQAWIGIIFLQREESIR